MNNNNNVTNFLVMKFFGIKIKLKKVLLLFNSFYKCLRM